MKTFGSLFMGFGGADLGAMMAGLTPIWGVELDPKIAGVGNQNLGGHIKIADVLGEDPRNYDQVDVFHASPPCPNFSVAKTGGEETPIDLAMASKVAEFITVLQPKIVTLENVIAYRKSKSWAIIERTLNTLGYWLSVDLVNFADLGVPQTRTRMIVRAIQGGFVPYMPQPEPWIGWYEAIADLIPTLPDSQFAPWQLKRLPKEIRSMLVSNSKTEWSEGVRDGEDPSFAVTNQSGGRLRAFVCEGSAAGEDNKFTMPIRMEDEPIFTQRATQNNPRAFIINGDSPASTRDSADLAFTVTDGCRRPIKVFSSGRVVAMTPRCLARFQSFPDHYVLPESKTLACKGIGNAVPPLGYAKIVKPLLEYI